MQKLRVIPAAIAVFAIASFPAAAQNAATVQVAQSEEHGQYLADGDGRALYMFTTDTQGQGDAQAQISCTGECLERWPPFYSEGEPNAGEMANAEMLGTVEHDGRMMITYNGWPLYYFFQDQGQGQTLGQDVQGFGGEWYLVSPQGEPISEE
jgi:predicted lipoprotein with Yx(FWY)xxD motif